MSKKSVRKEREAKAKKLRVIKVALPREGMLKIAVPKDVQPVVTHGPGPTVVVAPVPRRGGWWRSLFR